MDPAQIERGRRSVPSLPTALEATRRFTGWNKAGKQCACAVQQTRSPVSAAGSLTFGSRCLFPSGVTLIFRVSVTGLSTPPFRRLFSLPLFFFPPFFLFVATSSLSRPRGPGLGLATLRRLPARAGPRRAAGCAYLCLLRRQLRPGSVLAGSAAGPCSALRRGRR